MVLGASGNTNGGTVSVGAGQTQIQELEGGVGEPTLNTSLKLHQEGQLLILIVLGHLQPSIQLVLI